VDVYFRETERVNNSENIKQRTTKTWESKDIRIAHNVLEYHSFGTTTSTNDTNCVRLHFGLYGSYDFRFAQLSSSFSLSGHHSNIMYSDGLELEVHNKSKTIETFGVNIAVDKFIEIGENGNEPLRRFTENVISGKNAILSKHWKTSNFNIQLVVQEMIQCNYRDELKDLFMLSKSIELLVLQAELYEQEESQQYIKTRHDRDKLIAAKELLASNIDNPPTIVELSKQVGLNEYKLKKGFKELFGTTLFGYIHGLRMSLAKKLLLGTDKTAQEIAYETGYSSPPHFSKAFKKTFGVSPNSIRSNPDVAIKSIGNGPFLDFE